MTMVHIGERVECFGDATCDHPSCVHCGWCIIPNPLFENLDSLYPVEYECDHCAGFSEYALTGSLVDERPLYTERFARRDPEAMPILPHSDRQDQRMQLGTVSVPKR